MPLGESKVLSQQHRKPCSRGVERGERMEEKSILSRERRHREMQERSGQFEELLKREKRKQMDRRK